MITFSSEWPLPADYCPPVIGNGTLALLLDPRCSMEQREFSRGISAPCIFRTGYRYDVRNKTLVPFGFFETARQEWGSPLRMSQTLNVRRGLVTGTCVYEGGVEVAYEAFCRLNSDFIALKIKCVGGSPKFSYTLNTKRLHVSCYENTHIHYELDGLGPELTGRIRLFSEGETEFSQSDKTYTLDAQKPEEIFYLAFGEKAIIDAESKTFEEHLKEQEDDWSEYFAQGSITTPDEHANQVLDTSLYYLRLVTTPHSIPTGLFPSHWNGRYFCFDEYFDLTALVRCGHLKQALHVPEFRLKLLPIAQARNYNYNIEDGAAHYPWESGEDGLEATSDGYWLDHIFEHANVVLACYDCWKYSGDNAYAERYYPVIRACIKYFEMQHIYHDSRFGAYVGIVADLERLGPGKIRPYMTTCGVIAALKAAAEVADILGKDMQEASRWRKLADELMKNLPQNEERYLAYPDASATAIGMLSGTYPYPVIAPGDKKQDAAVADFIDREAEFGCMKADMGHEICTWYSAWKSLYFSRQGNAKMAIDAFTYAIESTGYFGESYESNRRLGWRPWFSTGSAAILQAAEELLFQADENILKIGPAVPEDWKDYEFLLTAPNDLKVHCKVENKKVTTLEFFCGKNYKKHTYRIIYPDGAEEERDIC